MDAELKKMGIRRQAMSDAKMSCIIRLAVDTLTVHAVLMN